MVKTFDFKLFSSITIGFVFFTIIGTLSHELGHCAAAKYLGMTDIQIHYGSMDYDNPNDSYQEKMYALHEEEIKHNKDFSEKEAYEKLRSDIERNDFIITASGPIQSMITGTIGLLLLIFYGERFKTNQKIKFMGWILVFLSLFGLRQSANFMTRFIKFMFNGKWGHSDEIRLAHYLHIPPYSISLITGVMGFLVLVGVSIFYIPRNDLKIFISGGLVGGISGYLI